MRRQGRVAAFNIVKIQHCKLAASREPVHSYGNSGESGLSYPCRAEVMAESSALLSMHGMASLVSHTPRCLYPLAKGLRTR